MIPELRKILDAHQKVLFIGIGNLLKHDDGIGVYIGEHIHPSHKIDSLVVEMSIEKYIGVIEKQAPEVVIMVDAVNINKKPGAWVIMPAEDMLDQTTHTHNISLKRIAEFFEMPVYILGIQPRNITFGEGFSEDVRKSANDILMEINNQ